ncbi:MAG: gliding motility-associated C-terminal domain-containing protein [Bacteroidota bacterium]
MYRLILLCFLFTCATKAFSQSDDCKDAEEIFVQEQCITKAGFTNDFTNEPLDNTCGSNTDDDGWFTFTAISEVTMIKLVSTASSDMGIAVYLDCERERTCTDRTAAGGTEELDLVTNIGQQYWVQIYDVRAGPGSFFICISAPPKEPISDCDNAEVICTSGAIAFNPTGAGKDDFAGEDNHQGCLLSKENQSAWYYFEIVPTAPPNLFLTFDLMPDNSPDYDFAIFGPNVDCDVLGYPIRCSYADRDCDFCPSTGLGMDTKDASENAQGDGFVTSLLVQPGEGFFLLIDNFSSTATGFVLEWGGTAAPYLNCKAQLPCGLFAETQQVAYVCEEEELLLQAETKISSEEVNAVSYTWEGRQGVTAYLDNPNALNPILTLPNDFADTLQYLLTVRDGACKHTDLLLVIKDCASMAEKCTPPMKVNLDLVPPNCADVKSASIQIALVEGGAFPYRYKINEQDFSSEFVFPNLAAGEQRISIKDAHGCRLDTTVSIAAATTPTLDLGMDITINQGEIIDIQTNTNISAKQIRAIEWIGADSYTDTCAFPCLDFSFAPLFPLNLAANIYTVEGCQVSDEIAIEVIPKSNIYVPSAFSPNGDGVNDVFTIYTGSGITNIQRLSIFNRWGDLVFQAEDIPPNLEAYGWDGTFKNQQLEQGVFVYILEIVMPGGKVNRVVGEVAIARF